MYLIMQINYFNSDTKGSRDRNKSQNCMNNEAWGYTKILSNIISYLNRTKYVILGLDCRIPGPATSLHLVEFEWVL